MEFILLVKLCNLLETRVQYLEVSRDRSGGLKGYFVWIVRSVKRKTHRKETIRTCRRWENGVNGSREREKSIPHFSFDLVSLRRLMSAQHLGGKAKDPIRPGTPYIATTLGGHRCCVD